MDHAKWESLDAMWQAQALDAEELESFRSAQAGGPKAGTTRTKRKKNASSSQENRTGNSESRLDLYKVLGLENYRYLATDSQIKKAHQAAAPKWHPDKHASASPEQQVGTLKGKRRKEIKRLYKLGFLVLHCLYQEKVKAKFQRIQLAFETLSNKQKRREYDSGEPFDESIPGQHLIDL